MYDLLITNILEIRETDRSRRVTLYAALTLNKETVL